MIYFGGIDWETEEHFDGVAEYKNLKWSWLGNLAHRRAGHHSIKMANQIFIFGGIDERLVFDNFI